MLPTPAPTPTPPPCDGERIDVRKPRGSYEKVFTIWEGRAMSVVEDWNYLPNDPGMHGGRIIITTAGTAISPPQQVSIPFEVHVYLKDTTLWETK